MSLARLTLGTAQFGDPYGVANRRGRLDPSEIDAILDTALDLGVRCLDTAADYGESESAIGSWLRRRGRPDGLAVCTKMPRLPPSLSSGELNRAVGEALDRSRRRLGAEVVDFYLLHSPSDLDVYGKALVDALERCRESGDVSRIGVSIYDPGEVPAMLEHPSLSAIQFPFNLWDRRIDATIERLRGAGCATFARSPLLQGLLTLSPDDLPSGLEAAAPWLAALEDLLRDHDDDPVSVCLAYAVARSGADSVVLGVESREQLLGAARSLETPLPPGLVDEIDRRFARVPPEITDPRRWKVRGS